MQGSALIIEDICATLKSVTFTMPRTITKRQLMRLLYKLKDKNIGFIMTETFESRGIIHKHRVVLKLNNQELLFIIWRRRKI